jgi:hypothetical protein
MELRDALQEGLVVRLGVPQDTAGVLALVSGMPGSIGADIASAFESALERHAAVVAVVAREVRGHVSLGALAALSLAQWIVPAATPLCSMIHLVLVGWNRH